MAIKSTVFGGTDLGEEGLSDEDWNDTFDAVYDELIKNTMFWNNAALRVLYDDFGTGDVLDTAKWDVVFAESVNNTTTERDALTVNSATAGGTAWELKMFSMGKNFGGGTSFDAGVLVTSKTIPSNRSIWCRGSASQTGGAFGAPHTETITFAIGNGTDGFTSDNIISVNIADNNIWSFNVHLLVVALGSDSYDVWIGGTKVSSAVSLPNGCQIRFGTNWDDADAGNSTLYIDDVFYSAVAP